MDLRKETSWVTSNTLLIDVEDLNKDHDIFEKESVTIDLPSPDAPLLKVDMRVNLNGILGLK